MKLCKTYFTFFILCFIYTHIEGQELKIDPAWSKAKKLQYKSWMVKDRNLDSTMIYARRAKKLAKIDKDTTLLIRIYKDLSYYYYWGFSDYYKTRLELDTLYNEFSDVMNPTDFANYYSRLGDVVYYDDQKVRSIEYYHKALDQPTWDSILIARVYHNLGWTYADLGFFDKAIEYASKGVDILKKKDSNPSANLHGLVYIYKTAKKYDKALEKLEEARKYNVKENILSYYYFRKADLLLKKRDYTKAFDAAKNGAEDAKINKKQKYYLYNVEAAFEALHLSNNYPAAYQYLYKTKQIAELIDNEKYLVKSYNFIGEHFLNEDLLDSSIYYLNEAERIQHKYGKTRLDKTYELLARCYERKGNSNKSLEYLRKNINYIKNEKTEDSLKFNKSIKDQLYRYQLENVVTHKELELEKKNNELLLEKEKEKVQRYIIASVIFISIIIAIFLYIIYKRLIITKKQKETIEEQKEELNQTNEELAAQRDALEEQKDIVQDKNRLINESIKAAQRIQRAFFTYEEKVSRKLPKHFIFFRPLGIVSGDFYWMHHEGDYIYIAVVDCTGHGIPGAFLSLLGASFLNEIVNSNRSATPANILDSLRAKIIKELNQTDEIDSSKEGMDISLVRLNQTNGELQYSGAHNPLYILRKGHTDVEIIKAHREPIGYISNPTPFENNLLKLSKGDRFYLFTDGFSDQFGGKLNKKYGYKRFRSTIIEMSDQRIEKQNELFSSIFAEWISAGGDDQIDDVCIIGVEYE